MLTKSRKLDVIVAIFFAGIITFSIGLQTGYSWTGNWNTISDGYIEIEQVNATQYYWNDENRTDVLANPDLPASYIMKTDGTIITAKNCTTGQIEYSGSSAVTVTQSAVGQLDSGGKIIFTQGHYSFSSDVIFPESSAEYEKPIILEGEGWNTILSKASIDPIFTFEGSTNRVRNIIIRDLQFTDSGFTNSLIYFNNSDRIRIEDCLFLTYNKNPYHIYAENTWDVVVIGCLFHGGGNESQAIIRLYNGDSNNCNNWRFIASRLERGITFNSTAFESDGSGAGTENHNIHFQNVKIHGQNNATFKANALTFKSTIRSSVTNSWIAHNLGTVIDIDQNSQYFFLSEIEFLTNTGQGNPDEFIGIDGDWCQIRNINSVGTPTQVVNLKANSQYNIVDVQTIRNTAGAVDELTNGGSANILKDYQSSYTSIANGEWVAHNLQGTPDTVQITARSAPVYDGEPFVLGVSQLNATHFRVSCYWVNGTIITDDAISIYWAAMTP